MDERILLYQNIAVKYAAVSKPKPSRSQKRTGMIIASGDKTWWVEEGLIHHDKRFTDSTSSTPSYERQIGV